MNEVTVLDTREYIKGLVDRARTAQEQIEYYTQEQVRRIAFSIAYTAIEKSEVWATNNYNETLMGDIPSKIARIQARARGLVRDLKDAKTVGIIEEDKEKCLVKIAKPVGVIGGLVPVTVPSGVVFMKAMNAIMGRNAIIFAPHPKAKKCTNIVANDLRRVLKNLGAPEDLIICVEEPRMEISEELMSQVDLIIATGGAGMVKAAYSSGTPAYGVGAGNVVSVIDETADIKDAANKIVDSQLNDLAIGCSTENSLVIHESVYDKMVQALVDEGSYLVTPEEKIKLRNALWVDGHLNPKLICRTAAVIAEGAGFTLPEGRTVLLVEETGYGPQYPFSGEKLSVTLTLYKYKEFGDAIKLVNGIQAYSGAGHSCGIHSFNEDHIRELSLRTKTARVAVRMPQNKSNAGNWNNGMPFTITLGCGTWGGNITCENVTYKHYINTTWVAREIPDYKIPTDEELFGDILKDKSFLAGV